LPPPADPPPSPTHRDCARARLCIHSTSCGHCARRSSRTNRLRRPGCRRFPTALRCAATPTAEASDGTTAG
jgi:hypothetical protein